MSIVYENSVAHGMTFMTSDGKKSRHTWTDWKLVPTSRPVFNPPTPKTTTVDIPGADGIIDLTEALTGDVKYNNRSGSFEFQVVNKDNWVSVYSNIMNFLHGQKMKIFLDDDPENYYVGRFTVNEWKSDKQHSLITFDYNIEPYKYELYSSTEDYLWDTFNFETGIVRDYRNISVDGELSYNILGAARKTVVPTITATIDEDKTLSIARWNGVWNSYELSEGSNKFAACTIVEGDNNILFRGYGTVTIDYRGGSL